MQVLQMLIGEGLIPAMGIWVQEGLFGRASSSVGGVEFLVREEGRIIGRHVVER